MTKADGIPGHTDSFTLALGDVVPDALQPRLMFLGEASSLSCFEVTPARAQLE